MGNSKDQIADESTAEELQYEEEEESSKGSKIINFLQKPFDFIHMMFQFIIYFMVKMATEGCMLPMNEVDENQEGQDEVDENESDGSRKEK